MEHASTEEFLKNVLSAVLPDYPVQNIYDIFSFEEEPAWPHGKWKVRLSDAAAEAILTRRDTEKKLISTRPGMIRLPDIVYEMEDAAPLGSKLEQNNWRMQLCEAKIKRTCRGVYFLAETRSLSDYDHMIHEEYEEKSVFRQPDQYETVFCSLQLCAVRVQRKNSLRSYWHQFAMKCYRPSFLIIKGKLRHVIVMRILFWELFLLLDIVRQRKICTRMRL